MKKNSIIKEIISDRNALRIIAALCITFIIGAIMAWTVCLAFCEAPKDSEPAETTTTTAPAPVELKEGKMRTIAIVRKSEYLPNPKEIELIGRTIWGEAGGVQSKAERAAVAWCILNRVDARGQSIEEVVTAYKQFHGYRPTGDCPQEHLELAADVLVRWYAEKCGAVNVGRTLPADYLYFVGDGKRNHFSVEYEGTDYWDWSLLNPYK